MSQSIWKLGAAAAGIGVLILVSLLHLHAVQVQPADHEAMTSSIEDGIAFLSAQENIGTDAVEEVLRQQAEARRKAELARKTEELANGDVDVWSLFGDAVVLGDSRAVGFEVWNFLPDERVMAEGGNTIRNIADHFEELKSLNPTQIFLSYGVNDVNIGFWPTPEDYTREYLEILGQLKEEMPHAEIYVNSIIPVQEAAFAKAEKWRQIPDYNTALGQMCQDNGYAYVDVSDLVAQHADLYDPGDGIHMQQYFYPYWAAAMMTTVYDYESTLYGAEASGADGESEAAASDDQTADGEEQ